MLNKLNKVEPMLGPAHDENMMRDPMLGRDLKKNKKNKSEMAKTNDELRKISKRLNQDSINKFIKERNGLKA